jgi:hypothetical protein
LGYVALCEDAGAACHSSKWAAGEKALKPAFRGSETLGNFGHGVKGGGDDGHGDSLFRS